MKYCTNCYVLYTKDDPNAALIGFGNDNNIWKYHMHCVLIGDGRNGR